MDTAVGLVQAYLRVNGYFTVAEYPVLDAWDSVGAATGTVQALGNADGAVVLVDDRGVVWIHGTETTVVLPTGTAQ